MWLDVKAEAGEVGIVIFFEIKVNKNKTIGAFKKSLIDIANQIFQARSMSVGYDSAEAEIKKIELIYVENHLTMESKSMLDQNDKHAESFYEVDEKLSVGQEFGYLERYVYVNLSRKKGEEVKESLLDLPSCTMSESLMQISSSMPVRNLRVEPLIVRLDGKINQYMQPKNDRFPDKTKCPCVLL